eukprot:2810303-Alexandrium_andersonii.AAC.1
MSASLVGSEMCIRDRASDEAARWPVAPSGAGAAVYPQRPETGLGVARACLLYTSDAADDM